MNKYYHYGPWRVSGKGRCSFLIRDVIFRTGEVRNHDRFKDSSELIVMFKDKIMAQRKADELNSGVMPQHDEQTYLFK